MDTWKEFDQNVISHSAAHHLMAVDELVSRFGYARVSDVARALNITRGSVSISLRPMKEGGLIVQDENRHLKLSEHGQALVDAIKTKRRVIENLLRDVLGVDGEQASIDACKIEHLISNETARQLVSFLRFLQSGNAEAQRFAVAWHAADRGCEHAPDQCPTCQEACLARTVTDVHIG